MLVSDTDQSILSTAVQFSKSCGSKLFVLFVIEPNRISRLAGISHQKVKVVYDKTEENGWQLLYLVEDEAVENGVWTSLHLEEGNQLEIVRRYIDTYQIDALLIKRKDESKKIFVSSPIPVIGL
jgi:nucleotide-binding universal stress UspA family protein